MKHAISLLVLGVVTIVPIVVTVACGGRVAGTGQVDDGATPPSDPGAAATPSATATATAGGLSSSVGLQPCPADSTPPAVPDAPNPVLLAQCKQLCERRFACEGCTYGTCLPNCLNDALASRPSGAPYVAWMTCLLAHDATCGGQPACDAEYCAYVRSGSSPEAPDPPECH